MLEAEEDFLQEACKEYQLRFLQRSGLGLRIQRAESLFWTLTQRARAKVILDKRLKILAAGTRWFSMLASR